MIGFGDQAVRPSHFGRPAASWLSGVDEGEPVDERRDLPRPEAGHPALVRDADHGHGLRRAGGADALEGAEHLADALVTADIARDAVLYQQYAPGDTSLAELLDTSGADRIVVHQATGMIAAQLDDTIANALARLRAAAFASGRSMYDLAQDVVERRVRFDD